MYNNVIATETKINNAETEFTNFKTMAAEQLKNGSYEHMNEYSRLSATLTGLKNHKASLIAEYNAKSTMVNKKIFKGTDLPSLL
jgi:hypothetical protein